MPFTELHCPFLDSECLEEDCALYHEGDFKGCAFWKIAWSLEEMAFPEEER